MSTDDLSRPPSPYLQIADHYRQRITAGDLPPGTRLPTAADLAQQWGVAPRTVHKAMQQLQAEHLVDMSRGMGTRVAHHRSGHTSHQRVDAVRETGRIYPSNERARIITAELCASSAEIGQALGVAEDSSVVRRDRVTFADDVPVTYSTSWLPGDLATAAPRLLETERITEGTFGYIQTVTGRGVADVREQYAAGDASADVARHLDIETSAPILRKRTWFMDEQGDVIEYGESATIAGRWVTPRGGR